MEQEALKISKSLKMMAEKEQIENSYKAARRNSNVAEGLYGLNERDNWLVSNSALRN